MAPEGGGYYHREVMRYGEPPPPEVVRHYPPQQQQPTTTTTTRTPSPPLTMGHRRQMLSSATAAAAPAAKALQQQQQQQQRRRGAGRRLPPTPSQPSTLNIDSLNSISLSAAAATAGHHPQQQQHLGADQKQQQAGGAINFPKLNASPSKSSLGAAGGRIGARLPEVPDSASSGRRAVAGLSRMLHQGRWSRSLEEPGVSFEEAVLAGRGSRQLPMTPGSARGGGGFGGHVAPSGPRRELPRPGTTIGFGTHAYPLSSGSQHRVVDESDDEDWC